MGSSKLLDKLVAWRFDSVLLEHQKPIQVQRATNAAQASYLDEPIQEHVAFLLMRAVSSAQGREEYINSFGNKSLTAASTYVTAAVIPPDTSPGSRKSMRRPQIRDAKGPDRGTPVESSCRTSS